MHASIKWFGVALLGLTMFTVATAQDAAMVGSIHGTVTRNGKPFAAAVRLYKIESTTQPSNGSATKPTQGAKGPKLKSPPPFKQVMADKTGEFSMTDVPAGDYTISAGIHQQGSVEAKVTVDAGRTVDVKLDIVQKPKPTAKPEKSTAT